MEFVLGLLKMSLDFIKRHPQKMKGESFLQEPLTDVSILF